MLRNNWLLINHYLLHLVGLAFICMLCVCVSALITFEQLDWFLWHLVWTPFLQKSPVTLCTFSFLIHIYTLHFMRLKIRWKCTPFLNMAVIQKCVLYIFLYNKTNHMHQFPKFTLAWNSACFGQFLCPSSGVYSLYTQQWCMSYRFVDSLCSCSKAVCKPVWHIPVPSVQWINSWW
jgi:hypothetical protein